MSRSIVLHKRYFLDFFNDQTDKVKDKIEYVLELVRSVSRVPETYLKHLEGTDGLFEVRVQSGNNIFRIFCFFDNGNLVVLMNGFQKKTQKTPKHEIELAKRLKREYFEEKGDKK
jgi:phage-related protein